MSNASMPDPLVSQAVADLIAVFGEDLTQASAAKWLRCCWHRRGELTEEQHDAVAAHFSSPEGGAR